MLISNQIRINHERDTGTIASVFSMMMRLRMRFFKNFLFFDLHSHSKYVNMVHVDGKQQCETIMRFDNFIVNIFRYCE